MLKAILDVLFSLAQSDAALLLGGFSILLLPFTLSWMKSKIIPDWAKFIIVCFVCAIGGYLTVLVGGQLVTGLSVVQIGALIGSAGLGIYKTVFGSLGLERVIFPRASVITEAEKSVAAQIGLMSNKTINNAVDPASTTTISVRAEAVDYTKPHGDPVVPKA